MLLGFELIGVLICLPAKGARIRAAEILVHLPDLLEIERRIGVFLQQILRLDRTDQLGGVGHGAGAAFAAPVVLLKLWRARALTGNCAAACTSDRTDVDAFVHGAGIGGAYDAAAHDSRRSDRTNVKTVGHYGPLLPLANDAAQEIAVDNGGEIGTLVQRQRGSIAGRAQDAAHIVGAIGNAGALFIGIVRNLTLVETGIDLNGRIG